MLSAAAMLVRRTIIDDVGGFDERFHMYAEDNEWCLRMTRADWLLMFQPESIVFHHGARSSLQRWTKLEKLRIQLEASYFFQEQSLPRRQLRANMFANCIALSGQHMWRRLRGIDAPDVKLTMQVYWRQFKRALRSKQSTRPKTASTGDQNNVPTHLT